jgi:hypothetical protein
MNLDQMTQEIAALPISTRVNICKLATLANYWMGEGQHPNSISKLARLTIEHMADLHVSAGLVEEVISVDEAADILQNSRILSARQRLDHSKSHGNALIHQTLLHTGQKTKRQSPPPTTPTPTQPQSPPPVSLEQMAQAEALLNQKLSESTQQRTDEAAARTQQFKDAFTTIPKGD